MEKFKDIFSSTVFAASILSILFTLAYWVPLRAIVNVWKTNDDYSYGFLILPIAAYLFWEMRGRLKGIELKSSWAAFPALLFFIVVSIYGILGSSGHIARPAVPVILLLMAAFCFGLTFTRKMLLPLGFLIFMVPLPNVLDRTIGVFLKSVSSQLGGALIKAFGISVFVSGNVIDLGVTKLQVVDACSGLRFVFPLLALGIVYAHFFENQMWKKIFLTVSTIPIAILTNGLRIGITGIMTKYYGPKAAEGFFHDVSGWVIFMTAFAFLFLLSLGLRVIAPAAGNGKTTDASFGTSPNTAPYPMKLNSDVRISVLVSAGLLLGVTFLSISTQAMPRIVLRDGIENFPLQFSNWNGRANIVPPETISKSGAEEAFSAFYTDSAGQGVSLYIGYRGSAFLENENFFHSPTVCLPAAGWRIIDQSIHPIHGIPGYGELPVTRMVMEAMGSRKIVYFWFQTKNKLTYDKNINRYHLTIHAIRKDNTYDLFIRPITEVQPGEREADADRRLEAFVKEIMPVLRRFLEVSQSPMP